MRLCKSVSIIGGMSYFIESKNIGRIEDTSQEFPDHTEACIDVYDTNNKLIHRIWNCPVDIEYLH